MRAAPIIYALILLVGCGDAELRGFHAPRLDAGLEGPRPEVPGVGLRRPAGDAARWLPRMVEDAGVPPDAGPPQIHDDLLFLFGRDATRQEVARALARNGLRLREWSPALGAAVASTGGEAPADAALRLATSDLPPAWPNAIARGAHDDDSDDDDSSDDEPRQRAREAERAPEEVADDRPTPGEPLFVAVGRLGDAGPGAAYEVALWSNEEPDPGATAHVQWRTNQRVPCVVSWAPGEPARLEIGERVIALRPRPVHGPLDLLRLEVEEAPNIGTRLKHVVISTPGGEPESVAHQIRAPHAVDLGDYDLSAGFTLSFETELRFAEGAGPDGGFRVVAGRRAPAPALADLRAQWTGLHGLLEQGPRASALVVVADSGLAYRDESPHRRSPGLRDVEVEPGPDLVEGDDTPDDDHQHGTHSAHVVAAAAGDGVRLQPTKVLDTTLRGTEFAVASALVDATAKGAVAVALGLTFGPDYVPSPVLQTALSSCRHNETLVFAAAGNAGDDAPWYPAALEGVVSVSAHGPTGVLAEYASGGPTVDLLAPGDADAPSFDLRKPGLLGEVRRTGTSVATAWATGLATAVRRLHPEASPARVLALLEAGGAQTHVPGARRLDPGRLAQGDQPPASTPRPVVVVTPLLEDTEAGLRAAVRLQATEHAGADLWIAYEGSARGVARCLADATGRCTAYTEVARRTPEPPPDLLAIHRQVLTFLFDHPGAVGGTAARRRYSDGFRLFVLDLWEARRDLGAEALADVTGVPLPKLKDWLRGERPEVEVPTTSAASLDPAPARIQAVLDAWERWEDKSRGFRAFCGHVWFHLRIPLGRQHISDNLIAHGVRTPKRRGRPTDASSNRGGFLTFFAGAEWVGDGAELVVTIDGERFTINLELLVDTDSGAFTGASIRPTEDADAVVEAFADGVETTGAPPIALLLDNKPSNHGEQVDEALGDTLRVRSRPFVPTDKPHVEGAFGLFSQEAPPLVLGAATDEQLAQQLAALVVTTWARAVNHRPRVDRDGKSRVQLYRDAHASPEQIAEARAALLERQRKQEKARESRRRRQDPVVRALLDGAFARLGLDDPEGHLRSRIACWPRDAVVNGIAVFEGKKRAGTPPAGVDGRYLRGIDRNLAEEAEGWHISEALLRERLAARDLALAHLENRKRDATGQRAPTDLVTTFTDNALASARGIDRTFWLLATADAIADEPPPTHRHLLRLAARRFHATYAVPHDQRLAATRFLFAKVVTID